MGFGWIGWQLGSKNASHLSELEGPGGDSILSDNLWSLTLVDRARTITHSLPAPILPGAGKRGYKRHPLKCRGLLEAYLYRFHSSGLSSVSMLDCHKAQEDKTLRRKRH